METKIKIVVDAMGGDYAPEVPVQGAVEALQENTNISIVLVGRTDAIKEQLAKYTYDKERIEIVHAEEVIGFDEPPVMAVRKKKDSSIVVGMKLVKKGEADAFVSAGSTGAILVGGQMIVGRIKGIERAPLAPLIPTAKGPALLIDCGANVDARASHLVQFAQMGSIYMKHVVGVDNPKVAIVNIGAEEEKGNQLVKETYPLLKECKDINFTGSIEARDIPKGDADVIVCEAFVGNVILKFTTLRSKIGALLIKPALKKTMKEFNTDDHGGAPLLGLRGLVVKTHGSSNAKDVKMGILQCVQFTEEQINEKIKENLAVKQED